MRKQAGSFQQAEGETEKNGSKDIPKNLSSDRNLEALCKEQAERNRHDEAEITVLRKQVMELMLSEDEYKRCLSKIEELSWIGKKPAYNFESSS